MNSKFFVPVLAFGIAALGAAASPSQAETNHLAFSDVMGNPNIYSWVDSVSLTDSGSTWSDAEEYQAQDGGSFYPVYDQPESVAGPGNFYAQWHAAIPPLGHSSQTFILNSGTTPTTSSGTWQDLTGIRSLATDSNGVQSFS